MTIAPNGVAIADYDPTGIGAVAFGAVSRLNHTQDINFGDVVVAADVGLKGGGVYDHTNTTGNYVTGQGAVFPGSWKCLGFCYLSDASVVNEAVSLFIRVA